MCHKRSVVNGNPCSIPSILPFPPCLYFLYFTLTVNHSLSVVSHNRPFPKSFYIAIIIIIKSITIIDNSVRSYFYLSIQFLSINIESIVLHQSTYIFPCTTFEMDTSIEMLVYLLLLVCMQNYQNLLQLKQSPYKCNLQQRCCLCLVLCRSDWQLHSYDI